MNLSPSILEAEVLNRTILEKLIGLHNVVERRGDGAEHDARWKKLLQQAIVAHKQCENAVHKTLQHTS